jgi:hypothetical protein
MNMTAKLTFAAGLVLAALAPQLVSAQTFVLDTGATPGGSTTAALSTSNWYAAEFALGSGETITDLSVYLSQGAGELNDTFTWDLYSTSGNFIGATTATRESIVTGDTTTGTYLVNGWNTVSVNWSGLTAGDYWIALQVTSTSQTRGLGLPTESSTSAGTVNAINFASTDSASSPKYEYETAAPIGLEVSVVPVPAAGWLLGSGLLSLGAMLRRRRSAQ